MHNEFGLIGLGVMGKSLSRNLGRNGFKLSLFNRHVDNIEENVAVDFIKNHEEVAQASGYDDLKPFVQSLEQPRKIFLMVPAGKSTDQMIDTLIPLLDEGDIIIDGGNAFYKDTSRRNALLAKHKMHFVGSGVSGGEKGALEGPSIMPGGSKQAYEAVEKYLTAIAAKDNSNKACCSHIGKGGSGHFVKMIHNGIEYAEMQLIAEIIFYLKNTGQTYIQIADTFEQFKSQDLNSYLLEISIDILRSKNEEGFLLDQILDKAGNKGTGGWSTTAAAELGVPGDLISSALFARYISAFKSTREKAEKLYDDKPIVKSPIDNLVLANAYKVARIVNHHQGFVIISEASNKNDWDINLPELARIWTNGCIIRSTLMRQLSEDFENIDEVLMMPRVIEYVKSHKQYLNQFCVAVIESNIPSPCFLSAYSFLTSYTTSRGSANVIQGQRDYFGAHTYQRVNDVTEGFYHTDWEALKA